MTKNELLKRYTAHQAEGTLLKKEIEAQGVSRKDLNALAVAQRRADKAQAALRELTGETDEPATAAEATAGDAPTE